MKFLIIACLALSAVAEPEPQHQTAGFVKYLNGAVVPTDTTSVLDQKALHGAAHATAAVNGYKFPFYGYDAAEYASVVKPDQPAEPTPKDLAMIMQPTVKHIVVPRKVVQYTNPLTYTYPYTYGLHHPVTYGAHYPTYPTYGVHHLGKREAEAEADPAVLYANYYGTYAGYPYATYGYPYSTYGYPYPYNVPRVVAPETAEVKKVVTPVVKTVPHVYGYPLTCPYVQPKVVAPETKTVSDVTTAPYAYGHHLTYTYAGQPTVHHLGKREAEAEADPAVLYANH